MGTVAYRVLVIASAVELYVLLQIKGLHDLIIMILHRWFIERCMLAGDGLNLLSTDDRGGIVNIVLVTYCKQPLYTVIIETLQQCVSFGCQVVQ